LEAQEFNISRSARTLGIDRVTLYNKIRRYGIVRQ
jgi:transcriptional regulator of acetoin/glycerol metabolism